VYRYVFALLLVLSFGAGCARKQQETPDNSVNTVNSADVEVDLPSPDGGFTLSVGSETITAQQIISPQLIDKLSPFAKQVDFERFKQMTKGQIEQLVVNRIVEILLYEQAKRQFSENLEDAIKKAVETEVRKFIAGFGGDYAKAERALRQMDMDWDSFREYQKKMMLSQYYISTKMPQVGDVTYREMLDEYNKVKDEIFTLPASLRFRLIDIEIARIRLSDPNQNQDQVAKSLADDLVERLNAGEDFSFLARQYSHGHRRDFGGLWNSVRPDSLAYPYDVIATMAEDIEPGQIAGPVEAGGHIFIMKLEDKQPRSVEPFVEVQKQIEAKILLERRKRALDKFGQSVIEQAQVAKKDAFVDFCLLELYRRATAQ
jgi:parvulin-like peptidyl-prolyl isomerase